MESVRGLCATMLNDIKLRGNCFLSGTDEAKSNEPRPRRMDYAQSSSPSLVQDQIRIDGNVTVIRQLYANLSLSKKEPCNWSKTDDKKNGGRVIFLRIKECCSRDIERDVLCICYTETHDFLAAGLTDGTVRLYKTTIDADPLTLRDAEMIQKPSPTTAVKHRPVRRSHPITRTIIATYANGCVKCWHYPSSQCLYTIRENRQTLGLAYHTHLPKFVTVGDDAKIYLYDEETKMQERVFQASDSLEVMDGHRSRVFSACFNPKSAHELITGGWDDTIQFWDSRQPYALRRISGVHMCGDGLDISANGREILSCAWQRENSIQLWDYGSGKLLVTLEPDSYSSMLYCGKYVTNMFIACGGTDDNIFRVIDLRSHVSIAMVRNLSGGTYHLDIGPVNPKHARKTRSASVVPQLAFCAGKRLFEIDAQPG